MAIQSPVIPTQAGLSVIPAKAAIQVLPLAVIPAQAGIHAVTCAWTPADAGVTNRAPRTCRHSGGSRNPHDREGLDPGVRRGDESCAHSPARPRSGAPA